MGNVIVNGVSYTEGQAAKLNKPKKVVIPERVVKESEKKPEKKADKSDN